jgi:hypothetical protein
MNEKCSVNTFITHLLSLNGSKTFPFLKKRISSLKNIYFLSDYIIEYVVLSFFSLCSVVQKEEHWQCLVL